ncbi:MAG: hypothetical protein EKK48_11410 [Candidatus Melainabacteria bacterium]|nr:MAG: hypothetical protein EKK48_11410 [Candidatus Melainabacteria bacterium]
MKRLAIALILTAAAPAVVSASSRLVGEITGRNELVSESMPSGNFDLISDSKSSRPRPRHHYDSSVEQPLDSKLTAGWL